MKEGWTVATFRLISIFLITTDGSFCSENISPHCDATTESSRQKLSVWSTNDTATSVEEPLQDSQWIDVCLSNGYLSINWTMTRTMSEGSDVKLCYEMESIFNTRILLKQCFMVQISPVDRKTQIFCWFKMEHLQEKPYIEALATYTAQDQRHYFYGDVNVAVKDTDCTNFCDSHVVHLRTTLMGCDITNRIQHDHGVSIERITFKATNSTLCQNILLDYSRTDDRELEFTVNCAYNGLGRIYFLYTIRGNYCHKFMKVRISCETGTLMTTQTSTSKPRALTTIAVVSVGALVTMITVITVIFVRRGRCLIRRNQQAQRQHQPNREELERARLNGNIGDIEETNAR